MSLANTKTPDEVIFEGLTKLAPGKYRRTPLLDRYPCRYRHLKGIPSRGPIGKDFNLGMFRFIDGSSVIWCMYGCGLKVWNKPESAGDFKELYEQFDHSSTNTISSSEGVVDPQPGRVIPEEFRKHYMRQSQDWKPGESYDQAAFRQTQEIEPESPIAGASRRAINRYIANCEAQRLAALKATKARIKKLKAKKRK